MAALGGAAERSRAARALRRAEPLLLSEAPFCRRLLRRWADPDHLRQAFPSLTAPAGGLSAGAGAGGEGKGKGGGGMRRFLDCDAQKNFPASVYHVREPETVLMPDLPLADFLDCSRTWRDKLLHFEAPLMRAPGHEPVASGGSSPLKQRRPECVGTGASSEGRDDLLRGLDWEWLLPLLEAHRFGPVSEVRLCSGMRDGLLPARHDPWERLLCGVAGRRRVLLVSPEHAFRGLYPYPVHHPYDRYSMVDFDRPDLEKWPAFRDVRGLSCVLRPGDVLYVPRDWFCHVQDLDALTVSLEVRAAAGQRLRPAAAAPLGVARLLESRVAQAEGAPDVRHWLKVIQRGEEMDWIDPATVKGYRRLRMCQAVNDEVEFVLGRGSTAAFLDSVCKGRLQPTPWLNLNFREPLYLLDQPVWLEDTRTEQEKAFPELFRRKLRKDGWRVADPVSTVPIPGYNMPADADYRTYGLEGRESAAGARG